MATRVKKERLCAVCGCLHGITTSCVEALNGAVDRLIRERDEARSEVHKYKAVVERHQRQREKILAELDARQDRTAKKLRQLRPFSKEGVR